MRKLAIIVSASITLALLGGGVVWAQMDTSTPAKAASACSNFHRFGANAVDVAKTADGSEVLAQVSWAANPNGWCFLALGELPTRILREYRSGTLSYPTGEQAAGERIKANYPEFYECASLGRDDCMPDPEPTQEQTVGEAVRTAYPEFYKCVAAGNADCMPESAPGPTAHTARIEVSVEAPSGRCAQYISEGVYAWERCAWTGYRENPAYNRAVSNDAAHILIDLIWEEVEVDGKPPAPPSSSLVPAGTTCATTTGDGSFTIGCYQPSTHHIRRLDAFADTLLHEVAHALTAGHPSIAECTQAATEDEYQDCVHNDIFRCVADHLYTEYAGIPSAGVCGTAPTSPADPLCTPIEGGSGCIVAGTSWARFDSSETDQLSGVTTVITQSTIVAMETGFSFPYDDELALLNVRCAGSKLDIWVYFGGQYVAGQYARNDRIPVSYRFNDIGTPQIEHWGESTSNKAAFSPNPTMFANSLAASSKLVLRAWNFDEDVVGTLVFDTTGADREVRRVLAACGIS